MGDDSRDDRPGSPLAHGEDPARADAVFWWLVRLRWFALGGVAVVILAAALLERLPDGAIGMLIAVGGALLAYNAALAFLGPRRSLRFGHFVGQIVADCLALAAFAHFAGGIENPFLPLFVLHVVNANIVLGKRSATFVLGIAIALLSAVTLGEGTGLIDHHCLRHGDAPCSATSLGLWELSILGGLVMTLTASSVFTRSLTLRLQDSQLRLVDTVGALRTTRATIERERAKLQAIIDCMGDAVIFADPDGQVLMSNHRARELDPGTFRSLSERFESFEEGRTSYAHPLFEHGERTLEITASVVRSKHAEPLGRVIVARDITERLKMERHLLHDERMSVVGKLAAAVAHEINNPIGVISLYSQHALAKLPSESPIQTHLETIRRNAESCAKITGDLLQLSRPRKPERRPVDLRLLCTEVAQTVTPLAARVGARLTASERESEGSVWAPGDADQLRQALLNLALNAIEAASEGDTITLVAYEDTEAEDQPRVLEVRDTGSGMSPEVLEKLFQPFFTTKATGTGLGLAVVENIVNSHAGRVEVDSERDHGTIFRIVLPSQVRRDSLPSSYPSPGRERGAARPS